MITCLLCVMCELKEIRSLSKFVELLLYFRYTYKLCYDHMLAVCAMCELKEIRTLSTCDV